MRQPRTKGIYVWPLFGHGFRVRTIRRAFAVAASLGAGSEVVRLIRDKAAATWTASASGTPLWKKVTRKKYKRRFHA